MVNFGFKAEKLLKTWSHLEAAEAPPEELQFGASPEATLEANILKPTLTAPNDPLFHCDRCLHPIQLPVLVHA